MLGCLEMNIKSCIDKYIEIMDYVFDNPRRLLVNPLNGELLPKYKQSKLKEKILEVISESRVTQGIPPEKVLMRRTDRLALCKV